MAEYEKLFGIWQNTSKVDGRIWYSGKIDTETAKKILELVEDSGGTAYLNVAKNDFWTKDNGQPFMRASMKIPAATEATSPRPQSRQPVTAAEDIPF